MIQAKFTLPAPPSLQRPRGAKRISGVKVDLQARLTLAEAALYFKLPKATINRWYSLGHLTDVTTNKQNQRLYLLRELLQAEKNTRQHPNSSRSDKRLGLRAIEQTQRSGAAR